MLRLINGSGRLPMAAMAIGAKVLKALGAPLMTRRMLPPLRWPLLRTLRKMSFSRKPRLSASSTSSVPCEPIDQVVNDGRRRIVHTLRSEGQLIDHGQGRRLPAAVDWRRER